MSTENGTSQIVKQVKAARRVSAPLVAINTADPAATIRELLAEAIGPDAPLVQWDLCNGTRGMNDAGVTAITTAKSSGFDDTAQNPVAAAQLVAKLPKESLAFFHNAHRFLGDVPFVQAVWNLRDTLKVDGRTLVMLGSEFKLPPELSQDVLVFDEPLPTAEQLAGIVTEQHENASLKCEPLTLSRAVEAVQGLSAFSAEQVTAMSLRTTGLDLGSLWERKRHVIESTPGLKVFRGGDSFDDIGGVEVIKQFLSQLMAGRGRPNAIVFVDEIEKAMAGSGGDTSGVSQDQLGVLLSYMQDQQASGVIFVGPPGCLAGSTIMRYNRGKRNSFRTITLEKLYRKFNGLPVAGGRGECTPWHDPDCKTRLHSYCHESGEVAYNEIVGVFASGVKQCIKVSIDTGEIIALTPDHPILTPDGFVEAGGLAVGDEVICRGNMRPTRVASRAPKRERVIVNGLKHYRSGANADITDKSSGKVYRYKRQYRARLVVEAALNRMPYDEYVYALKNDPAAMSLACLPDGVDVHHLNERTTDDYLENLSVLTKAEHTLAHEPKARFGIEYTRVGRVLSIRDAGSRETFDIQMASPCNNFATHGGLIVHNSAKSAIAKAAGNSAGVPTIQLDLGAMKGSLVGQSEQQLRGALKVVTSVSNGKSLWIATANRIQSLPPELRRRFTLGTFFFDLPTAAERESIWSIWRMRYDAPYESREERENPPDEGWTGAEIRQCCEIAWRLGCTLQEAARYIVPVSKQAADEIAALRTLANGRFLSASVPGVYSMREHQPASATPARRMIAVE